MDARRDGPGRLLLVPNALDLGSDAALPLRSVLADGVIAEAAGLRHWVVENARSARAFLKRVADVHPLPDALQQLDIRELPRPRKGGGTAVDDDAWRALLKPALDGVDVGLLSEAGLPAVADPGAALVESAHRIGVPVVPLAGASSLLLALAASGLNGQCFAFIGYLPQDAHQRAARLRDIEGVSRQHRQTQLFIETPYRNAALLAGALAALAPSTRLAVSCGITLPDGWTRCARIDAWRRWPAPERFDHPAVFALLAA